MKRVVLAVLVTAFSLLHSPLCAEEGGPDGAWLSEYEISVDPIFEYGEEEPFFPFNKARTREELKSYDIHLRLDGSESGKSVIREYQVSKRQKMIVRAWANCGLLYCRLNTDIAIVEQRMFHSVVAHRLEGHAIIGSPLTDDDTSSDGNGFAIFEGVLNPNDSKNPRRSFGVYCSRIYRNQN